MEIIPQKINLIQDSEGSVENRYPVLYSSETKINDARNLTMPTRIFSKKKLCK
jgi:hypothetical protein